MLKTIYSSRSPLRCLFRTLFSLRSNTYNFQSSSSTSSTLSVTPICVLSAPYSHSSKEDKEEQHEVVTLFNRDPTSPPNVFVVQPRLRPDAFLQAKLNEALCLANSLEEQREGYFDIDFFDKEIPLHVVVQNPAARGHKTRAGRPLILVSINYKVRLLPFSLNL